MEFNHLLSDSTYLVLQIFQNVDHLDFIHIYNIEKLH